ncbi:SDR family NAD(P)-dependent oxidoreductase [Dactylosporangium sp. NPDC048998]|uniref:putative quinol monooxygenase n=1 Tax=Dactylosporangium sp. NPDC048998 TaxID=3363976 RepID=UPI003710117E
MAASGDHQPPSDANATPAVSSPGEPALAGQTVVVIGGSAGSGRETARRGRAEGAEVILTGRDADRLAQAARDVGTTTEGNTEMSVVVVATAHPLPEHRAEVIAAFEAAVAQVHDEPGVDLYALNEGPDRLVMIEKYESEQARSAHAKGPALADLLSALRGKLRGNLDVQVLVPHPAGNPDKGRL